MLYADVSPRRATTWPVPWSRSALFATARWADSIRAAVPRTFDPPEWVYMLLLSLVLAMPLGLPPGAGPRIAAVLQLPLLALVVLVRGRRSQARAALRARQEAHCRAIVQGSSDVIMVMGPAAEILYMSPTVERVLGIAAADRMGRSAFERLHPDDVARTHQTLAELLRDPESPHRMELRVQHADGSWRWMALAGANRLLDPALRGIVLSFREVTEKKTLEEKLRFGAFHDPLTGLANRALLEDRLEQALAASRRLHSSPAVLLLDLDGFKAINDRLGHAAGDSVLIEVGRRIQACLRTGDTVARLGGDEFAVVAAGAAVAEARGLAGRILAAIGEPLQLEEQSVSVGASLGIAVASANACRPGTLLSQADAAMYAAKLAGGGHRLYYGPRPGLGTHRGPRPRRQLSRTRGGAAHLAVAAASPSLPFAWQEAL